MKWIRFLSAFIVTVGISYPLFAAAETGHKTGGVTQSEGPNGGTLLSRDDFALEITIFEQGVAPEMRIYAYHDNMLIKPESISINVVLNRLGGDQDRLTFIPEQSYFVSEQVVVEPHSFDVLITANYRNSEYSWSYESHDGRTEISDRMITRSGIETAIAQPRLLTFSDQLFGVIAVPEDQVYQLNAPYPSMVKTVHVQVGDQVSKGQTLVTLSNIATLQSYSLKSPGNGEVTARRVNAGARVEQSVVLEVTDLSTVWVEMSAFPESIEKLAIGQPVTVADMHQHESVQTTLSYISPTMTGGHIARARAEIANADGHWRPGMHIKAQVEVARRQVPLAVRLEALQSFGDMPVVFARFGNQFEVRMVELGDKTENYVEVLGGLKAGTEYVTENSFVIKADILKDGASHDH